MDEREAYRRLVASCPGRAANAPIDAYVSSFEDDGAVDHHLRVGAIAHHLVDEARAGRRQEIEQALAAAEEILTDGDGDARELVRMDLFEGLQNICSHEDVDVNVDVFVLALGPRGRVAWDDIDAEWAAAAGWSGEGGHITADEYGAVRDDNLRRYLQVGKRRRPDGTLLSASDLIRYHQANHPSGGPGAGSRSSPSTALVAAFALMAVALVLLVLR